MKFVLNGCDIWLIAEAPPDITLKELIQQCDKIRPHWCKCGICSLEKEEFEKGIEPDVIIGYDSIQKTDGASCEIEE